MFANPHPVTDSISPTVAGSHTHTSVPQPLKQSNLKLAWKIVPMMCSTRAAASTSTFSPPSCRCCCSLMALSAPSAAPLSTLSRSWPSSRHNALMTSARCFSSHRAWAVVESSVAATAAPGALDVQMGSVVGSGSTGCRTEQHKRKKADRIGACV